MKKHSEQLKSLFDSLERCHTVLADIFPHEGLRRIGGSHVFFRGPLLITLKECIEQILGKLKKLNSEEIRCELIELWIEIGKLVLRIQQAGHSEDSADRINEAAILLYLANGVTWNLLREIQMHELPHNPQYVKIEELNPLLRRCGWRFGGDVTTKEVIGLLQIQLKTCMIRK